jgi:hypothetical protein
MRRNGSLRTLVWLALAACGDGDHAAGDASPDADGDVVAGETETAGDDTVTPDVRDAPPPSLPRVHLADPEAAARGERVLGEGWPGDGIIPDLALRHLYLSWTENLAEIYGYYSDAERYWSAFSERYGTYPVPGVTLPLGFVTAADGAVSLTCLACHAAPAPNGEITIGLPNSRFDLQALHDELMALPAAFEALKQRPLPEPYASLVASIPVPAAPPPLEPMRARTAAAGVNDAMGLGIAFGAIAAGRDDVEIRLGFQTPAAWWQTAFKQRRYADGSVKVGSRRPGSCRVARRAPGPPRWVPGCRGSTGPPAGSGRAARRGSRRRR